MSKQTGVAVALFFLILNFQACTTDDASNVISQASVSNSSGNPDETEGGHEHGNGGDDTRFVKAAWFPDAARTVTYCVQVADGFPVAQDQVKESITAAMNEWNTLMTRTQLYSFSLISKQFAYKDSCDQVEVQFLFGTSISETGLSRIGFVSRDTVEPTTQWSKGRVWISSQAVKWTEPFRLKAALMHLWGEVLGFDNIQGTIMDNRWEQWLTETRSADLEQKLASVENDRRLTGVNGTFKGPVAVTTEMKTLMGITSGSDIETVEVNSGQMTLKLQSQTLRFTRLYLRELKHGELHKVVFFPKQTLYSWMKLIPVFYKIDDYTIVSVIQFIDLPGRPQMVLELNGDQAVKLTPL